MYACNLVKKQQQQKIKKMTSVSKILFFLENSYPENIYTFLSVVFKITCHLKTYDSIVVIYDFNLQDKYANTFFFVSVGRIHLCRLQLPVYSLSKCQ